MRVVMQVAATRVVMQVAVRRQPERRVHDARFVTTT
jgi:hypothetical protein